MRARLRACVRVGVSVGVWVFVSQVGVRFYLEAGKTTISQSLRYFLDLIIMATKCIFALDIVKLTLFKRTHLTSMSSFEA